MRSLIIGSILAITFSCSAYAKPVQTAKPKASPCTTVSDLNAILAEKGSKSTFEPVPADVYAIFVAKTGLPKGTKSMVAVVMPKGMIVAPLDARGCALASATFTMEELDKLGGKDTPPAAEKPSPEAHDGMDRV